MNKSRLSLLACVLLLGCDALIVPAVDPAKPDKPAVVDDIKATPQQFFTVFAKYVADGNISHTQQVVTECSKAMHRAGVTPPANYDAVMAGYAAKNLAIDDTMRTKIVADLKGFAR
jgi:hypothetical protein